MAYITVLWMEFWPAFLERMPPAFKQRFNLHNCRLFLKRYMYVFIGLGVLLPTMHQSSLGSVLLIMGSKLSPLWYTTWLPLLFLISALTMGYGVVMLESTLVSGPSRRPSEAALLTRLSRIVAGLALRSCCCGSAMCLARGQLGLAFAGDWDGSLFLIETALFPRPVRPGFASPLRQRWQISGGGLSLLAGGSLYRMNAYLMAMQSRQRLDLFPLRAGADDHHRRSVPGNHAVSHFH
jgi:Ni/Fe-hydrogenase subunit HybB-like protein